MLPKDRLARTIEHPKDFVTDRLDPEQYLQFDPLEAEKINYGVSVASRFILRNDQNLHNYGEKIVNGKNARYKLEKGHDPNPLKTYVGFSEFYAECVYQLQLTLYRQEIRWRPLGTDDAHFQVELYSRGVGTAKERRLERRFVSRAIFDASFGLTFSPSAVSNETLVECLESLQRESLQQKPEPL